MASKRRNMFHKNKTQETTEEGRCNLPPFCEAITHLSCLTAGCTTLFCALTASGSLDTFFFGFLFGIDFFTSFSRTWVFKRLFNLPPFCDLAKKGIRIFQSLKRERNLLSQIQFAI
ncbi:hypothetical protein AAG570_007265 [Ranatra chinensis]|uniref:Transmembrane protein n=1 Tax=Ranatra chinensis TaxID=642074 RepID=A0ABD0YDX1_9HEMI